jgi:hypothetical protein
VIAPSLAAICAALPTDGVAKYKMAAHKKYGRASNQSRLQFFRDERSNKIRSIYVT